MRFQCAHCLGVVSIDETEAGQPVACGHCGSVIVVPTTRVSPGSVIKGDFVVQRELGRGGMATVYLAHQLSLDRPVALKTLHPHIARDNAFIADFIREARAAARLQHPNIVQAYAVGEDEGIHFLAMEYVEGSTLKQVLAHSGRIVVDRALEIAQQVASGLEFAWANRQLVHRDVKPDNIILQEKSQVKLADLGLARPAGDLLVETADEIMGTPEYISPEQLLGQALDTRADIYSLGATLYHALTGRFPYPGKTPAEIARRHLTDPLVPPHRSTADVPETVSRLVQMMMAKRPEHRYSDPTELIRDLERLRQGRPPIRIPHPDAQTPIAGVAPLGPASPSQPPTDATLQTQEEQNIAPPDRGGGGGRRPRRALFPVAAAVVVLATGLGAWLLWPQSKLPSAHTLTTAAQAHAEVGSLIAEETPQAVEAVKAFLRDHPEEGELTADLLKRARPLTEPAIRDLRRQAHEEELAAWRDRGEQLRQQAIREEEERLRRQSQAETERQKRQESERREGLKQQRISELVQRRSELRWKTIQKCRNHEYAEARMLLAAMAGVGEAEFRDWASNSQTCIDMAEKAFDLVRHSQEKLHGTRFKVPGRRDRGKIDYVGHREISVVFTKRVHSDNGEDLGEQVTDRVEVPLLQVDPPTMWQLCQASWSKDGHEDTDELNLIFAAYLMARGVYPGEVRKRLAASRDRERAEPLLAELPAVEELLDTKLWEEHRLRLRQLIQQGNQQEALRYARLLGERFPEEYRQHSEEIRSLLQGD